MNITIALVQGDATGIGPELLAKLLNDEEVRGRANLLVISDRRAFEEGARVAGVNPTVELIEDIESFNYTDGTPKLWERNTLDTIDAPPGKVSAAAGAAVLNCFGAALDLAAAGVVDGICFMPFNKQAMHKAGLGAEDELQWAKARLKCEGRASEFNVIDGMWNARVTSHVPLRAVPDLLTVERIVDAIKLADRTLHRAGFDRPRIAVAALNPHAGDGGAIGREEIDVIEPAVRQAKDMEIAVDGPFPSDTLYIKVRDKEYDCALSMFHDQGQIAIKLLGFHMGVSVLGGLPIPITTPAHGTAFDIVGTNSANVQPARRAFMMVCAMARAANKQKSAAGESSA